MDQMIKTAGMAGRLLAQQTQMSADPSIQPPPVLKVLAWVMGLLALLHGATIMAEQTVQYLELRDDAGFLPVKARYHHIAIWKPAFYIHVFSSFFALFAAFTQFLPLRTRRLVRIHRTMGKGYVGVILLIAAPSGAILAVYAEGGWIGKLGFSLLATLWFWSTFAGLRAIKSKQLQQHLAWMTRSYALTFSAVTLREWQLWLNDWLPPHIDLFPITAWLGWVPNLLLAEWWIRRKREGDPGELRATPGGSPAETDAREQLVDQ
jgi:hypothetical protein